VKSTAKGHSKSSEVPPQIRKAFDLINTHLYSVEERIRAQAREFDPAVEGYVAYAVESSGKRLRPALALLAGGATGNICASHLDLAVVVELIHAASLVHDDIMDGADMRRAQPTANAKWGNTISVLLGDCLFAHALKLSTNFPDGEICRRIASATAEVCSGEIIQTQRRFDLKLSVADYYRIIEMKTAALFGAASELGAFINQSPPEVIAAMKTFGLKLGTAYQVYDDCLDIAGSEASAGKTLGTDLRKGKLTLPILLLLEGATQPQHHRLSEIILNGNDADLATLAETAKALGALKTAIESAQRLVKEAQAALNAVPHNKYRDGLASVCESLAIMVGRLAH
jgi:octaprenyl-diphosphate synthase